MILGFFCDFDLVDMRKAGRGPTKSHHLHFNTLTSLTLYDIIYPLYLGGYVAWGEIKVEEQRKLFIEDCLSGNLSLANICRKYQISRDWV